MGRRSIAMVSVVMSALAAILFTPAVASAAPGGSTGAAPKVVALDDSAVARVDKSEARVLSSWYSGTVAAGATQGWVWNNAGTTTVHRVGFSPAGASTTNTCEFEVIRSWYERLSSGERKFHFEIKNIGKIDCGATILLSIVDAGVVGTTNGLSPGDSLTYYMPNVEANTSYLTGLTPSGATSTTGCQFEVVRSWYTHQRQGDVATEIRYYFTVKNVGTITCVSDLLLGSVAVSNGWSTGKLAVGAQYGGHWNNANPLTAVYMPGVTPSYIDGLCQMEVVRSFYRQRINSDGSSEREFVLYVKNVGSIACTGRVLLASATA